MDKKTEEKVKLECFLESFMKEFSADDEDVPAFPGWKKPTRVKRQAARLVSNLGRQRG